MSSSFKRLLLGKPIPTESENRDQLRKHTALAVFSSDALSSVAYATEAILAVLIIAGTFTLGLSLPISLAITALLVIVGISYRQTIHAYPGGGGAYIVARENLGVVPGLVAAGALLVDYVLTVAVSISAGVAAITSLAGALGYPGLREYGVGLALIFIATITLLNLRGIRDKGLLFALPTYIFVLSILGMIAYALIRYFIVGAPDLPPPASIEPPVNAELISAWLILRAFAAGCTALTGIEAISDNVQDFKPPAARNAATTLTVMIVLLVTMFLGITYLANLYGVTPNSVTNETVLSQLARGVFGIGPIYVLLQVATALILVLAANTGYADFPRLAFFLARDRFLPRQLANRGERLVFSNGILVLGIAAAVLVVLFQANPIALLPLYTLGVFTSFTLSQLGMVRRNLRTQTNGSERAALISGIGALLSGVVLVMLALTKFIHGAWIVIIVIPILVLGFQVIARHYTRVAEQLSLTTAVRPQPIRRLTAVVLVSGVHKGMLPALELGRALAPDNVTAVYVNLEPDQGMRIRSRWEEWGCDVPLVVLDSPYRSLVTPVLKYVQEIEGRYRDDQVMVILPEFIPSRWWEHLLHNQTGLLLRAALMFRAGKTVISVPYKLER
ncbi:APC family permease [Candidatus Chloroploca asiatica]|uniref:Amino acid permease n=1 Tax=Candidatus Chloroploca asiatica TaxID=1506545 RepID=A0A2H3KLZ3_9CHLR|nr:APC family permease [Candidatus Chloroploca asiatica]PDV98334.1 amino acid permease [Candidatus Chloroploca asiatica]